MSFHFKEPVSLLFFSALEPTEAKSP